MTDWFEAKEALASGEATPVALYCTDAADLTRRIVSYYRSLHTTDPAAVESASEDWEADYCQVRSAIPGGHCSLIVSFLRDHANVLDLLGKALDPMDTHTWHLTLCRQGRGRPKKTLVAPPEPRQLGGVCAIDAKIALLLATRLEKRDWSQPDPLESDATTFLRQHAAFLDRLALTLDPPNRKQLHLTFHRERAGRRADPMLQMFKASRINLELYFASMRAGGKQEAAIEELKSNFSRPQIFRAKRHYRDRRTNSRN